MCQQHQKYCNWDFSQGSASSTNGGNSLSLVKTGSSTTTPVSDLLVDGELVAANKTSLKLSQSVTLNKAEDWTVELVAKGDGANAIRCFMSTSAALSGIYTYIGAEGDLSLVKKIAYTADDGTSVASGYTYYKVSNADFDASILNTDAFDITQYHTYQLRCVDGVISFWLDGEKIGNLALYEQNANRTATTKPECNAPDKDLYGLSTIEVIQVAWMSATM